MNKPVKYRAYHKTEKRMYFVSQLPLIKLGQPEKWFLQTYDLMEFSGLNDMKQKEMYEDDLIPIGNMIWKIGYSITKAQFVPYTTSDIYSSKYVLRAGEPIRDFEWLDGGEKIH